MQVPSSFVQVAVELPIHTPLDYRVPPALQSLCRVGQRVLVPVGNRQHLGYIVSISSTSNITNPRDIEQILDATPLLTQDLLQLTRWIAEYYMCPWGLVLKAAVPEGFRVRSTTLYSLTADALRHPPSWPTGRARDLLSCLAEHGAQQARELEDKLSMSHLASLLRRLASEGFIETSQHLLPPKARQRHVALVRLQLSAVEARDMQQRVQSRAPTQAAVLGLLHDQATWELSALRRQIPGATAAVKRLAQQGAVSLSQEARFRPVVSASQMRPGPMPVLNHTQQHALLQIEAKLLAPDGMPILLHGVTGSGKTEVYMRAIATALRHGKTALVLVPEISLTNQLVERFVARFSSRIAVLHSGLSAGERFDEWRRLALGEARIAIGARSAIFAPLPDLGLLIVDEEHDTSYKQEEMPRYNARDAAIVRAQQRQAVVVLGSATPALETFHHAKNGKYLLLTLPQRVEEKPLPRITVIDQRTRTTPNERIITTPLAQAITACLQRSEQCLILINRRGFASYLQCRDCGEVPHCVRCSVSLTYHRRDRTLKCHYCDYSQPAPSACPMCQNLTLLPFGLGTQQVEDALGVLFPTARLGRMDRDTTRGKAAHQQILRTLGRGDIDILVGTQMIAKGHDYPNITLVGVVSADATLAIPDFRAPERLFQLLTQVAGRAGRGTASGEVFMQTFRPDHYSVSFAEHHDYVGFFRDELPRRHTLFYPPFTRLARLLLDGPDAQRVQTVSAWVETVLQRHIADKHHLVVLGPAEAPVAKIHHRYRWHFLLKATSSRLLHHCLHHTLTEVSHDRQQHRGVRLTVDIDPLTFL